MKNIVLDERDIASMNVVIARIQVALTLIAPRVSLGVAQVQLEQAIDGLRSLVPKCPA